MKKLLFAAIAGVLSAASAHAALETPIIYTEDFQEMAAAGDYLTSDWTTYGVDATPVDYLLKVGFTKTPAYQLCYFNDNTVAIPMACTDFNPSCKADQWMITPAFTATAADMEFGFTVGVSTLYGSIGASDSPANTFEIRISKSGVDKEDFSEPIFTGSVTCKVTEQIKLSSYVIPIHDLNPGDKFYIAFVATGENAGLIGCTDLCLGDYIIDVTNQTAVTAEEGQSIPVSANVALKTPVECPGITAVLEYNDVRQERYFERPFGRPTGTSLIYQLVEFEDPIVIEGASVNYKISITPDYEGAPATVLTANVGLPRSSYPNNVVVEELTATGCGYCPSGIAALEYYADKYPGSETEGKFIGIAIHGYMNHTDPMSEGVYPDYVSAVMSLNGITYYPQAIFNRVSRGQDPTSISTFKSLIAEPAWFQTQIEDVKVEGNDVTASFKVRCGYDVESKDLRAALVLTEDDVQGLDSDYVQTNYFNTFNDQSFAEAYCEELVPYAKEFIGGPQYIKASDIKYQHVARGIYPSFSGQPIQAKWEADVFQTSEMSFTLPSSVLDIANTRLAVLILDESEAIVASDQVKLASYISGIERVDLNAPATLVKTAAGYELKASAGSMVTIYSIDGRRLASFISTGADTLPASRFSGMVVVDVKNANGRQTIKAMF